MRVFRIHPLLLLLLLAIFSYGEVALYAAILGSLLVHELGHLVVAYFCRVKVKSCVLLPYGAEITFYEENQIHARNLLLIALGGPFATACLALFAFTLPPLYGEKLIHIQQYLLFFNLLPIWSLDGGRIIYALILLFYPYKKMYEYFIFLSFIAATILAVVSISLLPKSLSFATLSIFLWFQVWKEWKYRKYRSAYEKIVLNRLT